MCDMAIRTRAAALAVCLFVAACGSAPAATVRPTIATPSPDATSAPVTTAPQQTTSKAAKADPIPARARRAKVATRLPHPRPAVIRLASRFYGPAIGYYFPLYLGIAY